MFSSIEILDVVLVSFFVASLVFDLQRGDEYYMDDLIYTVLSATLII